MLSPDYLHTFSLLFRHRFSCSDKQDVIVFSKSKPLFTRDSLKAWLDSMPMNSEITVQCAHVCWKVLLPLLRVMPHHKQSINEPFSLGVMQPTFPVSFREIRTHCSQNRGTQTQQAQMSYTATTFSNTHQRSVLLKWLQLTRALCCSTLVVYCFGACWRSNVLEFIRALIF